MRRKRIDKEALTRRTDGFASAKESHVFSRSTGLIGPHDKRIRVLLTFVKPFGASRQSVPGSFASSAR